MKIPFLGRSVGQSSGAVPPDDANDESLRGLGVEVVSHVKRLVQLEVQLAKEQALTSLKNVGLGIGLVIAAVLFLLYFVTFLLGTVVEATSVQDNWVILGAAGGLVVGALLIVVGKKAARPLLWLGALAVVASLVAIVVFLVTAIMFTPDVEGRRGWAITALTFLLLSVSLGAFGVFSIFRGISGGKRTTVEVKEGVKDTVRAVKGRKWHG